MKKYIKIMLILLSFLPSFVLAKECDWSEISAEKNLAKNISWSYEYYIKNNKMYFDITVSNVYGDLYVVDTSTKKTYEKTEFTIKEVSDNSKINFSVYSKTCGVSVGSKEISLPTYNKYHDMEYCEGIGEFSLCKKWQTLSATITEDVVKKQTDEYREELANPKANVIEYGNTTSNFYVIVGLILLALIILLILIIRGKREKDFI